MAFLNFLILFLQDSRNFFPNYFSEQPLLMYAVLGLQFLLLLITITFHGFSIPKAAFLLLIFMPLYLVNKLALHCVFVVLNIMNVKNLSLQKVVKYVLFIHLLFLIFAILALKSGLSYDTVWKMPKGSAHTLGFGNPNATSSFLNDCILLVSFYMILRGKSLLLNLLLLLPTYAVFKITYGRTYFFGMLAYFFFLIIFQMRLFYKHNYGLYRIVPIILGALLVIGIRLYEAYPLLDLLFSSRLSMSKAVIEKFSHVNYVLGSSHVPEGITIDCSYLFLLCESGIFSIGVFILLYWKFIKKVAFSEAKVFFPFLFCILIMGVSEITFPVFSSMTAIFYKILYQTAMKKNRSEVLL